MDAVNGNIEDAMTAFESIKNVVSYWNLALVSRCTWIKSLCFKNLIGTWFGSTYIKIGMIERLVRPSARVTCTFVKRPIFKKTTTSSKTQLLHKSILCIDFSQKSRRHWKWCPFSWRTRRMQKLSEKDPGLPNKDFRWQWFKSFSTQESKLQVFCSFLLLTIGW